MNFVLNPYFINENLQHLILGTVYITMLPSSTATAIYGSNLRGKEEKIKLSLALKCFLKNYQKKQNMLFYIAIVAQDKIEGPTYYLLPTWKEIHYIPQLSMLPNTPQSMGQTTGLTLLSYQ